MRRTRCLREQVKAVFGQGNPVLPDGRRKYQIVDENGDFGAAAEGKLGASLRNQIGIS